MAEAAEIVGLADAVAQAAKKIKQAKVIVDQVVRNNQVQSINWNAIDNQSKPDAVDANGLITGTSYTPANISNAIGSLAEFQNLYDNSPVSQGDHGGNFEKLVDPIV